MNYYRAGLGTIARRGSMGSVMAAPALLAVGLFAGGLHWITLSNKRRVALDGDGRVQAGLPDTFTGVDVRDVSPLSKSIRAVESEAAACEAAPAPGMIQTFSTSDAAVRELLAVNPELAQLLEDDCSHDCMRYRAWLNHGRRGPKPLAGPGDGRFDPLNERLELKGKRRVSSWLEAVYVTAPPSRRWADFSGRLPALEEATGLRLNLPAPAELLELAQVDRGACQVEADQQIGDLVARARAGRLEGDEVPF